MALLLLASALAACGNDTGRTTTAPPGGSTTTAAPGSTATSSTTSTTSSSDSSTTTSEATTTTGAATTTQAGDLIDYFFGDGDVLGVIGVAHDDVLNVRSGPGVAHDVIARLEPTAIDVMPTGTARQLESGAIWAELRLEDGTGWSNVAFLAYVGDTGDVTSEVVSALGETPVEDTMLDLGMVVAATRASEEPESDVTVTVAPTVGDLGEITIDVVGLGDDAVRGERLHVFGAPTDAGDGFSLMSVEATVLCSRGVTDDGLCI